ncbi:MAG: hypothetical protein LBG90_03345 [Spirochaetaceae bacterium]|nr:hypothetical protein [Spirochaetaceae bacterium]
MKRWMSLGLLWAVWVLGRAEAQTVLALGMTLEAEEQSRTRSSGSGTDTFLGWTLRFEYGYRFSRFGLGLQLYFGAEEYRSEITGYPVRTLRDFTFGAGVYFEAVLLRLGRFSFLGKPGLWGLGAENVLNPGNLQEALHLYPPLIGDLTGFCTNFEALFEYELFKYLRLYLSIEIMNFLVTHWKSTGYAGGGLGLYDPQESVKVELAFPFTQTWQALHFGFKLIL